MKIDLGIVCCLRTRQHLCALRVVSGVFWGPFACCKVSAELPGALGFTCSSLILENLSSFCCNGTVSTSTGSI